MLTGLQEVDGNTYYFGDDGARKYGWFLLPGDRTRAWSGSSPGSYFDKTGENADGRGGQEDRRRLLHL